MRELDTNEINEVAGQAKMADKAMNDLPDNTDVRDDDIVLSDGFE